jgi:transcriptional regulator with XRE-family HTH domain
MTATWITELTEDEEGRRLLEQERLILEVTESIANVMEEHGISRAELAKRLGKTPAFVTKLLRGDNNFTLRTLSDMFFAMDYGARLTLGPVGQDAVPHDGAETEPLIFSADSWGRPASRWSSRSHAFASSPGNDGDMAA